MILAFNTRSAFKYNEFIDKKNIVNGDLESYNSMLNTNPEIFDGSTDTCRLILKHFKEIDIYRFKTSLTIDESNIKFETKSRVPLMPHNKDVTINGIFDPFPDVNFCPDELSNFEFEMINCNVAISFLIGYHEENCSPAYMDKFLTFPFDKNAIDNSFRDYEYTPFKIYFEFREKKPNFQIKFIFKSGYLQNHHRNMLLNEGTIITENMVFGTGCFNIIDDKKKYEIPLKNYEILQN